MQCAEAIVIERKRTTYYWRRYGNFSGLIFLLSSNGSSQPGEDPIQVPTSFDRPLLYAPYSKIRSGHWECVSPEGDW